MLTRKTKIVVLMLSVLFLLILKYQIDNSSQTLPQLLQMIVYTSLPIAGGSIAVSFCALLGTFANVGKSTRSHLSRWASDNPLRNFFTGFLVTAYLGLIRPRLASNVPFLPYVEWVTVALAVYVMYTMTKLSPDEFYVSSEGLDWRRHAQKVRRETGRDLLHITSVMEQFADHGVKEPLLVHLTLHLQRLGETEESILKTLSPMIHYEEEKSYFSFLPWTKRKLAMRNKKAREVILKTLIKKINRLRSG